MKKILILSFAIFLVASINAYSFFVPGPRIIINAGVGQQNYSLPGYWTGYSDVACTHSKFMGGWTHTKNCTGAGMLPCLWDIDPANWLIQGFEIGCPGGTQGLEEYVSNQVANEIYSGSYNTIVVEDGTTYYKYLDWDYDLLSGTTEIIINVYYESN